MSWNDKSSLDPHIEQYIYFLLWIGSRYTSTAVNAAAFNGFGFYWLDTMPCKKECRSRSSGIRSNHQWKHKLFFFTQTDSDQMQIQPCRPNSHVFCCCVAGFPPSGLNPSLRNFPVLANPPPPPLRGHSRHSRVSRPV